MFRCTNSVEFTEHCVEDGLKMFDSQFYQKKNPKILLFSNPFYGNFIEYNVKPMIAGKFMFRMC